MDSAATSQKSFKVIQKPTSYYKTINSNVHRGAHTLSQHATAEFKAAHDKIQHLINAKSRKENVFTSGTTEALNLVASTFGRANIEVGDEFLFRSWNIIPISYYGKCWWRKRGFVLKYIPIDPQLHTFGIYEDNNDSEKVDMSILDSLITPNTKIVSIQCVSNVLACIHPISTIVSKVKQNTHKDCIIIVNTCQSIPHRWTIRHLQKHQLTTPSTNPSIVPSSMPSSNPLMIHQYCHLPNHHHSQV